MGFFKWNIEINGEILLKEIDTIKYKIKRNTIIIRDYYEKIKEIKLH